MADLNEDMDLSPEEVEHERISHAFTSMKFADLVAEIPIHARAPLVAAIGAHFNVTGKNIEDDKGLIRFFISARLRLESMPDVNASREVFTRAVLAARGIERPDIDEAVSAPVEKSDAGVPKASISKESTGKPYLYVAPKLDRITDLEDDFPSLLLPHPGNVDRSRYMGYWLAGTCWNAGSIAISFPHIKGAGAKMADSESEYAAAPDIFMSRIKVAALRPPRPGKDRSDWILEQGDRGQNEDLDQVRHVFAKAVGKAWGDIDESVADRLAAHGATLSMGDDAVRLVASAMSIERHFHDALDEQGSERARCLAHGDISPNYRLYAGITLVHAAGHHIVSGAPLAEALSEALVYLRLAQIMRITDEPDHLEISRNFDAKFFADCRAPLSSYSVTENEPELAHP